MISAVIATLNDGSRLTATLAALAPAAMDGLVSEVIVRDAGSTDGTLEVAEDAGATVVSGARDLAGAFEVARRPWLLILAAGARPRVGWEAAARAHMRDHPGKAGWFDFALAGPGLGPRLDEVAAWFESGVLARPRPAQGLLISKDVLTVIGPGGSHDDIVRQLGRGRLRRLGVRALMDTG